MLLNNSLLSNINNNENINDEMDESDININNHCQVLHHAYYSHLNLFVYYMYNLKDYYQIYYGDENKIDQISTFYEKEANQKYAQIDNKNGIKIKLLNGICINKKGKN